MRCWQVDLDGTVDKGKEVEVVITCVFIMLDSECSGVTDIMYPKSNAGIQTKAILSSHYSRPVNS